MTVWQTRLLLTGLLSTFVLSCLPLLSLPPCVDSYGFYWMVLNLPFFSLVTDPRVVAYGSLFFFQPLLVYLHYINAALVPWLGTPGHHVASLLGACGAAAVLASMVRSATGRVVPALFAAALFLFSPVTWFGVGSLLTVHYFWAVLFSLLSLRPAWRQYYERAPVDTAGVLQSALWYGLAVACKESAAAVPLLIAVLHYSSARRVGATILSLVPHGLVLCALLVWRHAILGGFGGYFASSTFVPVNLLAAAPTLFAVLWGHAAVALPFLVVLILRYPRAAVLTVVAYAAAALPFILALPFAPTAESGGRLILVWAMLLLVFCSALTSTRADWNRIGAVAATLLLALQATQFGFARDGAKAILPPDGMNPPDWTLPRVILSPYALWYAWDHQLHPEPKAVLYTYLSSPGLGVDLALGEAPPDAPALNPSPHAVPLDMQGLRYWADDGGHFHLRIAPQRFVPQDGPPAERIFIALQYANGKTRWTVASPVGRQQIDFPLSYSIRAVALFQVKDGPEWPVHVWSSPFFLDPYPATGETDQARISKYETRNEPEARMRQTVQALRRFGHSDFEIVSDFMLRVSDFVAHPRKLSGTEDGGP